MSFLVPRRTGNAHVPLHGDMQVPTVLYLFGPWWSRGHGHCRVLVEFVSSPSPHAPPSVMFVARSGAILESLRTVRLRYELRWRSRLGVT